MNFKMSMSTVIFVFASVQILFSQKTEILLLGSDHLNQVYEEEFPYTDVLAAKNQENLESFSKLIEKFNPEVVMVEVLPEKQKEIDSLYSLYLRNELHLKNLEYGRSEVYQLGFRIGKKLDLKEIIAVNSKGGTSQGVLDNGDNIEIYEDATKHMRNLVNETYDKLQKGNLSFTEFLKFLNQPEAYNEIYRLRYVIPARVRNGTFTKPDEMIDTAFVNSEYIGAELISVFKNRDYKIYSNIVKTQLDKKPKRMLLIIGVGHIGSLKSIIQDDPQFRLVDVNQYIKENESEVRNNIDLENEDENMDNRETYKEGCQKLLEAIRENNISKIKELVSLIDPNCSIQPPLNKLHITKSGEKSFMDTGRTPLVTAAKIGNWEVGRILLNAGAEVDFSEQGDGSPLIAASANGNLQFVKGLILNGANVNKEVNANGNALIAASREGYLNIVKYLLSIGAKVNTIATTEGTALINAVRNNHYEVSEALLESGADPNLTTPGDENAIFHANNSGNDKIVRLLKRYIKE